MYKILIVEDDLDIQEVLCTYLENEKYETASACDGISAIDIFQKSNPDLVLLDIMLPGIDGYGVCEYIRSKSQIPIIMLTALDSEENQLRGYKCKADDYVAKPFSIPILLEKISAILRRYNKEKELERQQMDISIADEIHINGDEKLLRKAIGNILLNA